jgi:protein MpaA
VRIVVLIAMMLAVAALGAGCGSSGGHSPTAPSSPRQAPAVARPAPPVAARRHVALAGPPRASGPSRLGRSEGGRPIVAVRAGDPHGVRVLVVGCIHGNEGAGIAIAHALQRLRSGADLWIVSDLNPDGHTAGTRQNGRGVDLNRNWPSQWPGGGQPWDTYYPGPRPYSERETRIAHDLILRVRPRLTIWFHQHMDLVWAWGPSSAAGRIYARAAGMRFYHHPWLAGTASNWQNHRLPGTASITVELPAGSLSRQQVRRHVGAVQALAARTPRSAHA